MVPLAKEGLKHLESTPTTTPASAARLSPCNRSGRRRREAEATAGRAQKIDGESHRTGRPSSRSSRPRPPNCFATANRPTPCQNSRKPSNCSRRLPSRFPTGSAAKSRQTGPEQAGPTATTEAAAGQKQQEKKDQKQDSSHQQAESAIRQVQQRQQQRQDMEKKMQRYLSRPGNVEKDW